MYPAADGLNRDTTLRPTEGRNSRSVTCRRKRCAIAPLTMNFRIAFVTTPANFVDCVNETWTLMVGRG